MSLPGFLVPVAVAYFLNIHGCLFGSILFSWFTKFYLYKFVFSMTEVILNSFNISVLSASMVSG